jgi:hypothetical protein
MGVKRSALLVLAVLLTACGSGDRSVLTAGGDEQVLHTGSGTVLQAPGGDPELCLGGVEQSLPPQCGGLPLVGWDWAQVDGEEEAAGTTWGEYTVTGRYDGTALTVTEQQVVGVRPRPDDEDDRFATACPEPAGGWRLADPNRADDAALQAAVALAQGEPDHAALWVDQSGPPDEQASASGDLVLNVAFTGHLARHEAELREVWGGPLCVVQLDRTVRELRALQDELSSGGIDDLGLEVLWSSTLERQQVIELGVVAASSEQLDAVEQRYGSGVVRVVPALTPVG